jgi:hypothetical protein
MARTGLVEVVNDALASPPQSRGGLHLSAKQLTGTCRPRNKPVRDYEGLDGAGGAEVKRGRNGAVVDAGRHRISGRGFESRRHRFLRFAPAQHD